MPLNLSPTKSSTPAVDAPVAAAASGRYKRGHGTRLLGAGLIAIGCLMATSLPARADSGFTGLDSHTLETLKRSDQRPKHAGPNDDAEPGRAGRDAAPALSSSDAARIAREREGGKVLNVTLEHGPSGPYYRVKILEQGRVQVVHVDAR